MAKKEESKIVIEREYNVPLRKEWLKAPNWNRTKKAVKALKEFLQKHMKSENVKLGIHLNEHMWNHGLKNPPHHVKVHVTKDAEGNVFAEIPGIKKAEPKKEEKKAEQKPAAPKKAEAPKEIPAKVAEKHDEPVVAPKQN